MPTADPFDATGAARGALQQAYDQQGMTALQHTSVLRSALGPVTTTAPREAGALGAAADAGVADLLTQQVRQQGIDPQTAIRLTSGLLAQRSSLGPEACTWATATFAEVLGLAPPGAAGSATGGAGAGAAGAGAAGAAAGGASPWAPPTSPGAPNPAGWSPPAGGWAPPGPEPVSQPGRPPWQPPGQADQPGQFAPPPAPGAQQGWGQPLAAPGASWGGAPGSPAPGQGWGQPLAAPGASWGGAPGSPAPGQGWGQPPGNWPPPGGTGKATKRTALIVSAVVIVVAAGGYLGAAAGASLPPFSNSSHHSAASTTTTPATTSPATSTTTPATTSPSTTAPTTTAGGGTIAPHSRTISQLMPADVAASDCQSFRPPVTGLTGLSRAIECTDDSLSGGTLFGLQFNSAASYNASVPNYNKWLGFDASSADTSCPPSSGTEGRDDWYDTGFPAITGQVVECLDVGGSGGNDIPAVSWFYPTQNAFIQAQGAEHSSLDVVVTWWKRYADAPGAA